MAPCVLQPYRLYRICGGARGKIVPRRWMPLHMCRLNGLRNLQRHRRRHIQSLFHRCEWCGGEYLLVCRYLEMPLVGWFFLGVSVGSSGCCVFGCLVCLCRSWPVLFPSGNVQLDVLCCCTPSSEPGNLAPRALR